MNKRMKKVVAVVCFLAQLITLSPNMTVPAAAAETMPEKMRDETDYQFEGDTFEVAVGVKILSVDKKIKRVLVP